MSGSQRCTGVGWIVVAALLALPGTGSAEHPQGGAGPPMPILLRISGFVSSAPAGSQLLGPLTLGVDQAIVTLQLTGVQTLNGPLTEGRAALRQFDLYSPNLLLVGDPKLLAMVRQAPPGTQLTIFGYHHGGDRRLILSNVETGPPPTP